MSAKFSYIVKEGRTPEIWVGYCPTLEIYSQGESEEEAKLAIKEAVCLYLKTSYSL